MQGNYYKQLNKDIGWIQVTILYESKRNDLIWNSYLVPEWLLRMLLKRFLDESSNVIFCDGVSNTLAKMSYILWGLFGCKKDVLPTCGQNCKDVQQSTFNLILYVHLIIGLFSHASMHHLFRNKSNNKTFSTLLFALL